MKFLLFLGLTVLAEPFPHAKHTLKCTYCHKGAETQERATFPAWSTCKMCHPDKPEEKIPSQRVYRVPDFVFFSHGAHTKGKVECTVCHGDVKAQAVLTKHRPTTMAACVDCHKERQATVKCTVCHELGQ